MAESPVPAGLLAARDHVRDELRRADSKATTLLSLVGAALAGVVALTGRNLPPVATIALWASAVPIGLSVLLLLAAIRPNLNGAAPGSWLSSLTSEPYELVKYFRTAHPVDVVYDVQSLARIACRKFIRIRRAVNLLVLGLVVLAAALVASVVPF
jgi:hypothetical protein